MYLTEQLSFHFISFLSFHWNYLTGSSAVKTPHTSICYVNRKHKLPSAKINHRRVVVVVTLTLGVVPAVLWAMSVPAQHTALPCWRSSGGWQLWVLSGLCRAGGRRLHRTAAVWRPQRAAVWLQRQFPRRAGTVRRCEQNTLKHFRS